MNKKNLVIITIVVGVVLVAVVALALMPSKPGIYDDFATCLKDSGAKFYGTFWCPHCLEQKKIFGKSVKFLPYVECSNPQGNAFLPICTDKGIDRVPTWEFADGSKKTGVFSIEELAEFTSCPVPNKQ